MAPAHSRAVARYGLPVAITEAHLGATREEQMRWLTHVWREAQRACDEAGADCECGNRLVAARGIRLGQPAHTFARLLRAGRVGLARPRRGDKSWRRPTYLQSVTDRAGRSLPRARIGSGAGTPGTRDPGLVAPVTPPDLPRRVLGRGRRGTIRARRAAAESRRTGPTVPDHRWKWSAF